MLYVDKKWPNPWFKPVDWQLNLYRICRDHNGFILVTLFYSKPCCADCVHVIESTYWSIVTIFNYITLVCLKFGLDFLLKNWDFGVFAKQAFSKKSGLLRFRQTRLVQKIRTFLIRQEGISPNFGFSVIFLGQV